MLVPQLLRDLEVQDVGTKLDIVFEIELHFFLGLGGVGGTIPPFPLYIYYTISRRILHVNGSLFTIYFKL